MARLIDSGACCEHQHRTSSHQHQPSPRPVFWQQAGKHTEVGVPPSRASVGSSRAGVTADLGSHTSSQEPVCAARGPRRSLDAGRPAPSLKETTSSRPQSIKQRLRQRRFSYAMGDSIPLRTIKECSRQEDAVVQLDQLPAAHNSKLSLDIESSSVMQASAASSSSSSSCSSYCDLWRSPQAPSSSTCSVAWSIHISSRQTALPVFQHDQQRVGTMSSLIHTQAGVLALLQHSTVTPHTQQRPTQHDLLTDHQQQQHRQRSQPRRQSAPPQVLRVHDHEGSHTLTGLNQEQIWRYLQQQRCEQLEQQDRWRAQAHRLQQEEADELQYWQQHEHEWAALLQRLHELSYSTADAAAADSRVQGDERMQCTLEHWWAGQHRDALVVLQQIEAELHEIEATHKRLAAARAIAAPGSAAALACESALLQHQAVLQQALAARADIAAAVSEAATALSGDCREYVQREEYVHPSYEGAEAGSVDEYDGARFDFSWEGFEDEHLHPSDTEALPHPQALLQHFGHYAII